MTSYTVLQDGIKECGSACLLSIIKYYGGNISINKILELTNTNKDGTNFYNISLAAKELGLSSIGYKVNNTNELINYNFPFISQTINNNLTHFMVIYNIKKDIITVMDPAKGMRKIKIYEFNKIFTGYILLLTPYKNLPVYKEENYIKDILKNVIHKNKSIILKLILFTILSAISSTIYSYYLQILLDKYLYQNRFSIFSITTIFLIILFIIIISQHIRNILLLEFNKKIDLSIITTTIKKIIFLPYSYYKNKTSGDIISRINDLFYIKNTISKIILTLFLDTIMSFVSLIILIRINLNMTLLLVLLSTIYILIFLIYRPHIKKMTNINQENNSNINSLLIESVNGYNSIKGLNLENIFENKIGKLYQKNITDNLTFSCLNNDQNTIINLFEDLIILFITFLGVTYIMDKSLSIGSLITYTTIMYYFINPIKENIFTYNEIYYVKNSINRINNLLNITPDNFDKTKYIPSGNISFNKLNFTYNKNKTILNNITFNIKDKEKILILGPSGSGKSTILKILYKYFNISNNMVKIDNIDLNEFTLKDIRNNISYISQDEVLYTDTIRNNILLDRDIPISEFNEVVKLTKVNDIVSDNILSYDYVLLEGGANLSGGQKQRIVLARTLLQRRKIYLIDEGLNQIDVVMEREILKNIFNNYEATFIIVSHRMENIDLYDRVIKIDNGIVIDDKETLMEEK